LSNAPWFELLPQVPLAGDTANQFSVDTDARVTHLKLNIYPDGGVARFRVFGDVRPDDRTLEGDAVDLAAMENGGYVVLCSDMFFGHRQNLILPGRSTHMGNGWETKRRRGPGHDWTIVRLATRGIVHRIELDTDHYKGNAPAACSLDTCDTDAARPFDSVSEVWLEALPRTPLQPHTRHVFEATVRAPATHARLNIYPDGGVARLRLVGRAVDASVPRVRLREST
jgi:allantoicase